jgi:hypothetical protein
MNSELTELERRLVEVAVAAAPRISDEQALELKRVLKPYLTARPSRVPQRAERKAA